MNRRRGRRCRRWLRAPEPRPASPSDDACGVGRGRAGRRRRRPTAAPAAGLRQGPRRLRPPRRRRRQPTGRPLGGRRGVRPRRAALRFGLSLPLLLTALSLQRLAHPHILEPLCLDLLQPDDLGLGSLLPIEERLLGVLQLGLVGGDLLLVRLERRPRLVEVVHRVGRRLVDDVDQHVRLQLLARQLVPREQRDPRAAARHEPVHGHLLDLGLQGIDLSLQLSVLLLQRGSFVGEHFQLRLRSEVLGGGVVGAVPCGLDLPRARSAASSSASAPAVAPGTARPSTMARATPAASVGIVRPRVTGGQTI